MVEDESFSFDRVVDTEGPSVVPEDEDTQAKTPQAQLLAWHYRLGHLSFAKIQQMAGRGDLPARLTTCKIPKCAACMFGKATRRPWRSRAPVNKNKIPPVNKAGSVVGIDMLVSATPGLIAQMRGFLTGKKVQSHHSLR